MFNLGDQINELLRRLIDRRYIDIGTTVINAIASLLNGGLVGQRFEEFEAEAARLADLGQPLTPDNPVLRALTADLLTALGTARALVEGVAGPLSESGAAAAGQVFRQVTLGGLGDDALAVIGVQWNRVDPEALAALVNYATNPAWQGQLSTYINSTMNDVVDVVVRGFVAGQNPRTTAAQLLSVARSLPYHRAETIMRTLQLMSYRQGERAHAVANADILSHRIRIAVLDARTCMACVALHGTRLAVDELVTDHPRGRCTSIGVVKGITRTVQTGEAWFESLTPDRQRQQMGGAAWSAWQAGAIQLKDLVHKYEDDLYGEMIREASLKGVLGDGAREYYRR